MAGAVSIKSLREETGKSRALVAAELDISERHLLRLEADEHLPRRWVLVFAAYYGVDPDTILGNGVGT